MLMLDPKIMSTTGDPHTVEMFLLPKSGAQLRLSFIASFVAHVLVFLALILLVWFALPDLPPVKLRYTVLQPIDSVLAVGSHKAALGPLPGGSPRPVVARKAFPLPPGVPASPPVVSIPSVPAVLSAEPPKLLATAAPVQAPVPKPELTLSSSKQFSPSNDRSAAPLITQQIRSVG